MIAVKQLGNDTRTGLVRKIEVMSIDINSKDKVITVYYEVNLYSNNEYVSTEKRGNYRRFGVKFDNLEASIVGQGIKGMINLDLDLINNIETIDENLTQN